MNHAYPVVADLLESYYQEAGSDYNNLFANGIDPFYMAVRAFEQTTARFWFNKLGTEFKPNRQYPNGQTIAYLAVQDGDLQTIKMLFHEMHFDIDIVPNHGYSILGNATENTSDEVFNYLLTLPNINLQICDQVAPFASPLHKACKQQDLSRVSMLLMAMLKHEQFLSPKDLKILHEFIEDKNALRNMLDKYVLNFKEHLHLTDEHLTLTHDYKARHLLAYLELWNINARVNHDLAIAKLTEHNKTYSGADAIKLVLDKFMPLIGFGMLAPNLLPTVYKTIKQLARLYSLPESLHIEQNLDQEISQAINKYSHSLEWSDLQKFTAADLSKLASFLDKLDVFVKDLHLQRQNSAIEQASNKLIHSLAAILEPKLSLVKAHTLSAKLTNITYAMQHMTDVHNLQQFVSLSEHHLPKAVKALLLREHTQNHIHPESSPKNSHDTFKPKSNKK
jgi:hypothetical protein